jgi:hypothetical protein
MNFIRKLRKKICDKRSYDDPSATQDSYEYTLLCDGQIRLFEILSDSLTHGNILRIKLHHKCLNNIDGQYRALSYVWGEPDDTQAISVVDNCGEERSSERLLRVRVNLFSALKELKAHYCDGEGGDGLLFWADAICINQLASDMPFLREREQQVQIMHKIYSLAFEVIVHIGLEETYVSAALEIISLVQPAAQKVQEFLQDQMIFDFSYKQTASRVQSNEEFTNLGLPLPNDFKWTAWVKLMAHPWFRRVWIIQEYVMARRGTMIIGSKQLPLQAFAEHISQAFQLGLTEGHRERGIGYNDAEHNNAKVAFRHVINLSDWRHLYHSGSPQSLDSVLSGAYSFEMTHVVDRMYALMSISGLHISDHPNLYVSYTEPPNEVYLRFNKYLGQTDSNNLYILLAEGPCSSQSPSWSPDWSKEAYSKTTIPLAFTRNRDRYKHRGTVFQAPALYSLACQDTDRNLYAFQAGGSRQLDYQFSSYGNYLIVRGLVVDTVSHIGPAFVGDVTFSNEDHMKEMWHRYDSEARAWLKREWRISQSEVARKHPSMHHIRRAYARALIGAASYEYKWPEHEQYLFGAWSHASEEYRWNIWGIPILEPTPKITQERLETHIGLDDEPFSRFNERIAYDAFILKGPSRVYRRRLCIAESGTLCLCPQDVQAGDLIVILYGMQVPYVLRKKGVHYNVVGEAYIQDMMVGEALEAGATYEEVLFTIA